MGKVKKFEGASKNRSLNKEDGFDSFWVKIRAAPPLLMELPFESRGQGKGKLKPF